MNKENKKRIIIDNLNYLCDTKLEDGSDMFWTFSKTYNNKCRFRIDYIKSSDRFVISIGIKSIFTDAINEYNNYRD